MTPRRTVVVALALALTIASGCSTSSKDAARTVKVADNTPSTATPSEPVLLAAFDTGVGAVQAGAAGPLWFEPDAVAAPDGSSVFSVRHSPDDADQLVRIDTDRGEVM